MIALVIYEIWSYTVGLYERRQKLGNAGCDPEPWNQYGTPTIWICQPWIDIHDPSTHE
jgi:hypothetical protein